MPTKHWNSNLKPTAANHLHLQYLKNKQYSYQFIYLCIRLDSCVTIQIHYNLFINNKWYTNIRLLLHDERFSSVSIHWYRQSTEEIDWTCCWHCNGADRYKVETISRKDANSSWHTVGQSAERSGYSATTFVHRHVTITNGTLSRPALKATCSQRARNAETGYSQSAFVMLIVPTTLEQARWASVGGVLQEKLEHMTSPEFTEQQMQTKKR